MCESIVLPPLDVGLFVGRKVRAVTRPLYEYDAQLETESGPVELSFDDGTVALFDSSADGETVRVTEAAWLDPFALPLSRENEAFVRTHGKWCRVDMSDDPRFSRLIGEVITAATLLRHEYGALGGVHLTIGGVHLWIITLFDECIVDWQCPEGFVEVG